MRSDIPIIFTHRAARSVIPGAENAVLSCVRAVLAFVEHASGSVGLRVLLKAYRHSLRVTVAEAYAPPGA